MQGRCTAIIVRRIVVWILLHLIIIAKMIQCHLLVIVRGMVHRVINTILLRPGNSEIDTRRLPTSDAMLDRVHTNMVGMVPDAAMTVSLATVEQYRHMTIILDEIGMPARGEIMWVQHLMQRQVRMHAVTGLFMEVTSFIVAMAVGDDDQRAVIHGTQESGIAENINIHFSRMSGDITE